MADERISEHPVLAPADLAPGDLFRVVDISDLSGAASGRDKRLAAAIFDAAYIAAIAQGELPAGSLESQLGLLDARTGATARLTKIRECLEVYDEFTGMPAALTATGITGGPLGWTIDATGTGGGVLRRSSSSIGELELTTGTTTTGRGGIHLPELSWLTLPVFTMEWRADRGAAAADYLIAFGSGDIMTAEPGTGAYFLYDQDVATGLGFGSNRLMSCTAQGGTRTRKDTGVDLTGTHQACRITGDGLGIVRFFVGDMVTPKTVHDDATEVLPDGTVAHKPVAFIQKQTGTSARTAHLDWFYFLREGVRA